MIKGLDQAAPICGIGVVLAVLPLMALGHPAGDLVASGTGADNPAMGAAAMMPLAWSVVA